MLAMLRGVRWRRVGKLRYLQVRRAGRGDLQRALAVLKVRARMSEAQAEKEDKMATEGDEGDLKSDDQDSADKPTFLMGLFRCVISEFWTY